MARALRLSFLPVVASADLKNEHFFPFYQQHKKKQKKTFTVFF